MDDYAKVQSLGRDGFERRMANCSEELSDATLSDKDDINKIEQFLDLGEGGLRGQDFRLQRHYCAQCNRQLTFYDVVYTGVVDAGHSKSFILHTLLGSKFIVNDPSPIRCSACNAVSPELPYQSTSYGS